MSVIMLIKPQLFENVLKKVSSADGVSRKNFTTVSEGTSLLQH